MPPSRLSFSIIIAASLIAAGCDEATTAAHSGDASRDAVDRSDAPTVDYQVIPASEIPDPCDYLTQDVAESGLAEKAMGRMEGDEGIDPMSCNYTAMELRKSFDQKIRHFTLTAVEWPRDRFNSEGLNDLALMDAVKQIARHDALNMQGALVGRARVFMADEEGTTHVIVVTKIRNMRDGAQYPGGEIVVLSRLDNSAMTMAQRNAAIRKVANAFVTDIHDRAHEL